MGLSMSAKFWFLRVLAMLQSRIEVPDDAVEVVGTLRISLSPANALTVHATFEQVHDGLSVEGMSGHF